MRGASTRARRWGAVAAAVALLAGMPTASLAVGPPKESPDPVTPGQPGQHWAPGLHQSKRGSVHTGNGASCYVVSNPNYLGGVCTRANGGGSDQPTIEEILDGDPLPDCWDAPLEASELDGLNLANSRELTWYWHKCLKGIDPETLRVVHERGPYFLTQLTTFVVDPGPEDEVPVELTDNQQALVDRFFRDGSIPAPFLAASPEPIPLVNQDVSFFNHGEDVVEVTVPEVGVTMRARITGMTILPEGRPGPVLHCDGTGYEARPGETRRDHPDGCWHRYERSSLGLEDDVFQAEIHTHWTVEVGSGGTWTHFHDFTKSAFTGIAVNEVQALVRP